MSVPSQLKIDNWGNFFMQRLNNLAKKDEYCDYTIRSTTNESFKVHRVVLNTCSDYFVSHPSTDKTMTMPAHLDFDAVKSVIMFMYTGQLHFTEDSRISLIEVADMLQVTVLLKLLESQSGVQKFTPKYHSPQASSSRTHSAIALNQYRPAKKPTTQNNSTFRSPPEHTPASTFINTMKVKDVLSENKPMRFECDADDVPEFIENTFELPKYDSAPLIKQENSDSAKAMLKRASNGELIDKSLDKGYKTQVIKCEAQSVAGSSPASKKLKIVSDTDPENTNSKVVQEILKKYPHLLQSKGNIKLKIMSSTNQSQFESIIINTPNSVEKILPAGSGLKKPITTHKVKPDIMNLTGPWSCNLCGTDTNPLKLDSYFIFRRHLVEKHNEKEDTRVCEHCGHFSVRKSLQIHHMYTKHKIQPPADYKFPQCDDCGFVATTEVHLKRHKSLEKCGTKAQTKTEYGNYTCTECDRTFRSSLMLKGHLRNFHKVDENPPSTSSTKELLISVIDNIPPGAKVLAENNIINETDDLVKGEVIYSEDTTEVETITLEDAEQVLEENEDNCKSTTVPADITEEWDDFDDADTNKNEESDKEDNRDAKPCRIELE
ncbi:centrosome-associated zinc finger protein CP190 [Aphis gossypii]|uniref:centrosome-associated zinc finger protein CP190 n=1 Tax=Aphis gossypii TaxID=80765 RepID=UPI002159AB2C|nr:centrosome-associated zinc finger protein CP190 [Aphis gossypii]XP_027850537.2 centrosome-associated zinc finger protein CP190 [Aphis gossypii]XP_027850538.2 centrosome-associated zinc finger protein CP190 [Aphis gossypii]